jgi:chromosomal replication initiation ATPase DnaA
MQDTAPAKGSSAMPLKRDDFAVVMARLGTVEERLSNLARRHSQRQADQPGHSRVPTNPLVAAVMRVVCHSYAVTQQDIEGQSQCPAVVQARWIAMYLCRKLTLMSYPKIAHHFGNRSHTTVLRAFGKINQLCVMDKEISRQISEFESEVLSSRNDGK